MVSCLGPSLVIEVMFRTYEGRKYRWRYCQRGEFQCSVQHNNVIVTTRADNINQSGQYSFSCGGAGGQVCFSVQVGVVSSQVLSSCQPHISLPSSARVPMSVCPLLGLFTTGQTQPQ